MDEDHAKLAGILTSFKRFDMDGNGKISLDEVRSLMQSLDGRCWSDERVEVLLKTVDKDGSGFIDYTEFVDWIKLADDCTSIKTISVALKTLSGQETEVQIAEGGRVADLKQLVNQKLGHAPEEQTLVLNKTALLDDSAFLHDVNVVDGSKLSLILRPAEFRMEIESVTPQHPGIGDVIRGKMEQGVLKAGVKVAFFPKHTESTPCCGTVQEIRKCEGYAYADLTKNWDTGKLAPIPEARKLAKSVDCILIVIAGLSEENMKSLKRDCPRSLDVMLLDDGVFRLSKEQCKNCGKMCDIGKELEISAGNSNYACRDCVGKGWEEYWDTH